MTAVGYMWSGLRKLGLVIMVLLVGLSSGPARAETAGSPLTTAEIEQLVAPVALYPDTLLSQVLMAATYPLEVVEAVRWTKENPGVTGKALEDAMQNQRWDPSVKALTAVPQTLAMMGDQLKWTQDLGDAFLGQQTDVIDAIQRLRARADAAGNLKSTPQQRVTRTNRPAGSPGGAPPVAYIIEPVTPDEYFIPIYDPVSVYGPWPYATYMPFFWHPPGYVVGPVFAFGAGVFVGAAIWGGVNWWNRSVNVNVNRYNQFNRTNITSNNWTHNAAHRQGVAYRDPKVSAQFGDKSRDQARDAARQKSALTTKGGKQGGMGGDGGMGGMGDGGMGGGGKSKGAKSGGMGGDAGMGGGGGMAGGGGGMAGAGGGMAGAGGGMAGAGGGMAGGGGGMAGGGGGMAGGGGGMVGGGGGMVGGGGMAGGGMGGGGMGGGMGR